MALHLLLPLLVQVDEDDEDAGTEPFKYVSPVKIFSMFKNPTNWPKDKFPKERCFMDAVVKIDKLAFSKVFQGALEFEATDKKLSTSTDERKLFIEVARTNADYKCHKQVFKVGQLANHLDRKETQADKSKLEEDCILAADNKDTTSTFTSGTEGQVVKEDTSKRGCEYSNRFEGEFSEPASVLIDSCDEDACCGKPGDAGPAPTGCPTGMPTKKISKHFTVGEILSKQPPKSAKNSVRFPKADKQMATRNRYFRMESRLLTCMDMVVEKANADLFSEESAPRKIKILDGYWTRSQADVRGGLSLDKGPGLTTHWRHQAGTALRFTYAAKPGEPRDNAKLIELTGYVVSECGPYVDTLRYTMGLGLLADSVYIDLRKRGENTFETFSTDGSALATEDFEKWVQRGRYVQHAKCHPDRPPQAPGRQHPSFEYVATAAARRRRGRREARRGITSYIMGSGEYCENTEALRKTEFDNLWTRISQAGSTSASTEAKEALFNCYMACSGGLIMKLSDAEDEKHKACSEAVHWLPVLFSQAAENVEECHFYPSGNADLKRSACFWGNCIDIMPPHALIWPSFLVTAKRTIDPLIGKNYEIDESLFDDVLNPTPMHSVMQETFAMHCGGRARVHVSSAEDVTGMRNTLRALFGYVPETVYHGSPFSKWCQHILI